MINRQCKEKFQSSDDDLHSFLTFLLMAVAFSAFAFVGIIMDDKHAEALHLDSFSVIDFRVVEDQLVANWTAKFIISINKRIDEAISIDPFDLLVFYNRTNLISCASIEEPLVLKTKYEAVMEVEFSPEGCNEAISISDEVEHELEEDIKKGKIGLKLSLDFEAKHKGILLGYGVKLEPSCDFDLEFNLTKLSAERFSGTLAKNCHIPFPASDLNHHFNSLISCSRNMKLRDYI